MTIGIGLLGLGTVGAGVASILSTPTGRDPLVAELQLRRVAVRDLKRPRPLGLPAELLSTDPEGVVDDPAVDIMHGLGHLLIPRDMVIILDTVHIREGLAAFQDSGGANT